MQKTRTLNRRDERPAESTFLDDLEEAHAVVMELVLLARQLWVLSRALRERVELLSIHLSSDERPVLDELAGVIERLLGCSRQTFTAMMQRGPHAPVESPADVLRRQDVFGEAAREVVAATDVCGELLAQADPLTEPARRFVEEAHAGLADVGAAFFQQAVHWRRLRELLQTDGRTTAVRDVFVSTLPGAASIAPDYEYELTNISRHMHSLHEVEKRLQAEVRLARKLGASWVKIGLAAGITPQGAYRRWDEEGQRRRRIGRSRTPLPDSA